MPGDMRILLAVMFAVGLVIGAWATPATAPGWWLGGVSTNYPSAPSAWLIPDGPTPFRVKGDYRKTNHFGPDADYDATFLPDPPR